MVATGATIAHCPVSAIPPPALAQQAGHGLRGWAFRRHWLRATTQPADQTTPPCPPAPWRTRSGHHPT
jgi:hypothetical protein